MTEIKISTDLTVELIDHMGNDESIVRSARVSTGNDDKDLEEKRKAGLINYLIKNDHVSTLEHCFVTFRIKAPIFVAREMVTHKGSGLHWNEISGRYTKLSPEFYAPPTVRPLVQAGSGAHPKLVAGDDSQKDVVADNARSVYTAAWNAYEEQLNAGVATEVARNVLPVGIYTQWYASATLREWLHILELRLAENAQWEIRQVAQEILKYLRNLYPVAIEKWEATHDVQ